MTYFTDKSAASSQSRLSGFKLVEIRTLAGPVILAIRRMFGRMLAVFIQKPGLPDSSPHLMRDIGIEDHHYVQKGEKPPDIRFPLL